MFLPGQPTKTLAVYDETTIKWLCRLKQQISILIWNSGNYTQHLRFIASDQWLPSVA